MVGGLRVRESSASAPASTTGACLRIVASAAHGIGMLVLYAQFRGGPSRPAELHSRQFVAALPRKCFAEEVVHPLPRIVQHVRSREVVKLAWIGHELEQRTLALLHQLVHQAHRMEKGNVDVGGAVQDEKRTREPIDVRERRRLLIDRGILLRRADPAVVQPP